MPVTEKGLALLVKTGLQLKVLHWQATSWKEHQAFDLAEKDWSAHLDNFIETSSGKGHKITLPASLEIVNREGVELAADLFTPALSYLLTDLPKELDKVRDVDLLALRDDLVQTLNILRNHLKMGD